MTKKQEEKASQPRPQKIRTFAQDVAALKKTDIATPTPSKEQSKKASPSKDTTPAKKKMHVPDAVAVAHSAPQRSLLTNKDDVFDVSDAFESPTESGTIITDKRRKKLSFGEMLFGAAKEWAGDAKRVIEDIEAEKPKPVKISSTKSRAHIIAEATKDAKHKPQDDHQVVVEKIRTLKQDAELVTGKPYVIKKPSGAPEAQWSHVRPDTTDTPTDTPEEHAAQKELTDTLKTTPSEKEPPAVPTPKKPSKQKPVRTPVVASVVAPAVDTHSPEALAHLKKMTSTKKDTPKAVPTPTDIDTSTNTPTQPPTPQQTTPTPPSASAPTQTPPTTPSTVETETVSSDTEPETETKRRGWQFFNVAVETKQPPVATSVVAETVDTHSEIPTLEALEDTPPTPAATEEPDTPAQTPTPQPAPRPTPEAIPAAIHEPLPTIPETPPSQSTPVSNEPVTQPPRTPTHTIPSLTVPPFTQATPDTTTTPEAAQLPSLDAVSPPEKSALHSAASETPTPTPTSVPPVAAEPRSVQAPQQPTPTTAARPRRQRFVLVTILVLCAVAGAGVGAYLIQFNNTQVVAPLVHTIPGAVIPTTNTESFPYVATRETLLRTMTELVSRAPEGVSHLYPVTTDELGTTLVPAATLLQTINTRTSGAFLRSLDTHLMFGAVRTLERNEPFLFLTTTNFDTAFAGMLAWEPYISSDLAPLFGSPVSQTYDINARTADNTVPAHFVDAFVRNRSVRILYDELGAERIVYTILDTNMILMTKSTRALSQLLELR